MELKDLRHLNIIGIFSTSIDKMSGIIVPPLVLPSTDQTNNMVYTVKKANIPITLRIRDQTRLISFKNVSHATTIASSFEAHYVFTKLWPDMTSESFHLSKGPFTTPAILDIFQEDFDEVREYCALWNIGLLVVENLKFHDSSILFNGHLFSFEVDGKDYIDHLENIIALE